MNVGIGAVLLLSCGTGCNMQFRPRGYRPTPLPAATPLPVAAGELAVSARPAYRLVTSPILADAPSRLLVLQVRVNSGDDRALTLAADDLAIILPTGEQRRVFDRGRALELLRRTTLAEADFSYTRQEGYVPGGVDAAVLPELNALVVSQLLNEGAFTGGYVVQGYVVVDTGVALASLDGSSFHAVAYRLSDSVPAQGTYQFGSAATATPTTTPLPATQAATAEPIPAAPAAVETAPLQPAASPEPIDPAGAEPTPAVPAEPLPTASMPVETAPTAAAPAEAPPAEQPPPVEQATPAEQPPVAEPSPAAEQPPAVEVAPDAEQPPSEQAPPADEAVDAAPGAAPAEPAAAPEPAEQNPPTPRGTR